MWIHNTSLIKSFSLVKCPIHNPEKLLRSDRIRISDPGIRKKYKSGFVQYWTVLIACSVCSAWPRSGRTTRRRSWSSCGPHTWASRAWWVQHTWASRAWWVQHTWTSRAWWVLHTGASRAWWVQLTRAIKNMVSADAGVHSGRTMGHQGTGNRK